MANHKHRLFKQYKSGYINFDVYNSYKNNNIYVIKLKMQRKHIFVKSLKIVGINDSKKLGKI